MRVTTLRVVRSPPAQRPSDRAGLVESDPTTRCPPRVSNPGLLLPESDALPTELPGAPVSVNPFVCLPLSATARLYRPFSRYIQCNNLRYKISSEDQNNQTGLSSDQDYHGKKEPVAIRTTKLDYILMKTIMERKSQ